VTGETKGLSSSRDGLLLRFTGEEGWGLKKTPGFADKQLSGGKSFS
jgi:hypothetical protein